MPKEIVLNIIMAGEIMPINLSFLKFFQESGSVDAMSTRNIINDMVPMGMKIDTSMEQINKHKSAICILRSCGVYDSDFIF